MIPYGGFSGAPIIDMQGKIRGVESGFILPDGMENEVQNYIGAAVAPLKILAEISDSAKRGRIFTLPTNCEVTTRMIAC